MSIINKTLLLVTCATFFVGCATQDQKITHQANASADRQESYGDHNDSPGEATEFYRQKRLAAGMREIPVERLLQAREQMRSMQNVSSAQGLSYADEASAVRSAPPSVQASWTALGPGNIGGRTRSIVIDPNTPATMYTGSVSGGVWKTTNAGALWSPLTDTMANLAVASLAMDPTDSNTLYAGTGEGSNNIDAIRGAGIFKTSDAGASWSQLAATANSNFYYVNDVAVSPNNSQIVVAATSNGLWVSSNGGGAFTQQLSTARCMDLAVTNNGATETWLASCGNFAQATVYRSTNATLWTAVLSETDMGRTAVAIQGNRAYAIASSRVPGFDRTADVVGGDYLHQLHAFFSSLDGGQTWTPTVRNTDAHHGNTMILSGYFTCGNLRLGIGQGWYDITIAIDPANPNIVWAGGVNLFRSDDSGLNWGRADNIHPDHHTLAFHPQYNGTTNQTLYNGQDGGLYRTNNARAPVSVLPAAPGSCAANQVAWTSLNNSFAATQFYHGAPYPDGTRYMGGAQDNSTIRGSDAGGPNLWESLTCGDGGYNAVDPVNTNILYAGCQNIDIRKSTNGTSFSSAVSGITGSSIFIPAFAMDPNNNARLWFAGSSAFRTDNAAASWVAASTAFGGNATAVAIAPGNSNLVLMGTSSGNILRSTSATSDTASSAWASLSTGGSGYISAIAFAPSNANIVYATVSTFGQSHVRKSIDGGATWSNASGTGGGALPDVPALGIAVHPNDPNKVFAGTDVGVFSSSDGGTNWAVEITAFPNVSTEWLSIVGTGQSAQLFAFTHGRGAFRASLATGSGTVGVSTPTQTVFESAGTVTVTVNRNSGSDGAISVAFQTIDGTAVAGSDYVATSGTLNWANGDSSPKNISVTLLTEPAQEPNETFSVTLSGPTGGATLGSATQVITILDTSGEVFPVQCQMPVGWTVPVTATTGWHVTADSFNAGICSLKSSPQGHNAAAQIQYSGVFTAGNITLARRVSSELNWDCFRVLIDGIQQNVGGTCTQTGGLGASGEVAWGNISIPITAGTHTVTFSFENDAADIGGENAAWIDSVVFPAVSIPPVISSAAPSNGTFGVAYNHQYTATGTPAPTFSVSAGALPTSVTLAAGGAVSGTPSAAGLFSGTVTASNSAGSTTQNFSINIAAVAAGAPTISSASPGNTQATFTITPPASNGGAAISNYVVTCTPGPITGQSPTSPVTVTGLANNTTYSCTATATNSAGTSSASNAVNVTPNNDPIFSNGFEQP